MYLQQKISTIASLMRKFLEILDKHARNYWEQIMCHMYLNFYELQ